MQYIVKKSFYEGNTLHLEGSTFSHEDLAYVQECLADGNIVEGGSEGTTPLEEASAPSQPEQSPETVESQPIQVQEPEQPQTQPVQPEAQLTSEQLQNDFEALEAGSTPSENEPQVQIS